MNSRATDVIFNPYEVLEEWLVENGTAILRDEVISEQTDWSLALESYDEERDAWDVIQSDAVRLRFIRYT